MHNKCMGLYGNLANGFSLLYYPILTLLLKQGYTISHSLAHHGKEVPMQRQFYMSNSGLSVINLPECLNELLNIPLQKPSRKTQQGELQTL